MRFISELSRKEYLSSIEESLDSPCNFGIERFTGWVKGNFFSVKYHYNENFFDRRYPPTCNKIMGFVSEKENKAVVKFLSFKGI